MIITHQDQLMWDLYVELKRRCEAASFIFLQNMEIITAVGGTTVAKNLERSIAIKADEIQLRHAFILGCLVCWKVFDPFIDAMPCWFTTAREC